MAVKRFDDYEKIEIKGDRELLELGGHPCIVTETELKEYDWGDVLIIYFDIAGGKQKGFYAKDYKNQTQEPKKWKGNYRITIPTMQSPDWAKEQFKRFITSIELSNQGYKWNWDETELKGKKFGGVFGRIEYSFDGKTGFYVGLRWTRKVDGVENSSIPQDKLLKGFEAQTTPTTMDENDDLPF